MGNIMVCNVRNNNKQMFHNRYYEELLYQPFSPHSLSYWSLNSGAAFEFLDRLQLIEYTLLNKRQTEEYLYFCPKDMSR